MFKTRASQNGEGGTLYVEFRTPDDGPKIATVAFGQDFSEVWKRARELLKEAGPSDDATIDRLEAQATAETPWRATVNWSAWGDKDRATTELFLEGMQCALRLAETLETAENPRLAVQMCLAMHGR